MENRHTEGLKANGRDKNEPRWIWRKVGRDFWRNNLVEGVTRFRADYNTDGYLLIRSLKYQEQFAVRTEYK